MASSDARPVPIKNVAFRLYAEIRDGTGALITGGLTGMDSERSLDGASFADCTNEFTEIGTTGIGYLDLTTTEMNTDCTVVKITVTNSDAKPTVVYLYPEEAGDINVDVTAFGGTAGTFSGGRAEVNTSHWAGTAVGSATVRSDLINIAGAAVSTSTAQLGVNVVNVGGSAVSASSGLLNANVTQISGDATAADNAESFFDGTGYAGTNNVIPTVTTLTGHTPQTGDAYAIVNNGTHGNAAIKGYVDDIGTAGAGLTGIPWNAAWDAEVQSEVQDAIEANNLHRLFAATGTVSNPGSGTSTIFNTSLTAADDAYNDQVLIVTSGTLAGQTRVILDYAQTNGQITLSEALTAAPSNGVSFALLATHVHPVSQIQSGLSTHSASDVWAVATRVLTAGTNIQLPSNGLANVSSWTVAITGNVTGNLSGSVGSVSGNVGGIAGTVTTLDALNTSLSSTHGAGSWATATGFSTHSATDVWAAGTRTLTAGTNIALAKGTGVTGFTDLSAADVRTAVGLASANLDTQLADLPTVAEFEARTITAASYATAASVAALWTTAITEAYAADGAAFTPAQALYMIYSAVMEFSISGTTLTCKKLDGSTTAMTVTLNDATNPTSRTRSG